MITTPPGVPLPSAPALTVAVKLIVYPIAGRICGRTHACRRFALIDCLYQRVGSSARKVSRTAIDSGNRMRPHGQNRSREFRPAVDDSHCFQCGLSIFKCDESVGCAGAVASRIDRCGKCHGSSEWGGVRCGAQTNSGPALVYSLYESIGIGRGEAVVASIRGGNQMRTNRQAGSVGTLACPLTRVLLPKVVLLSLKVTVPVGVPFPFAPAATVDVSIKNCPKVAGFTDDVSSVVTPLLLTVWVKTGDVLPSKLELPLYTAVIECRTDREGRIVEFRLTITEFGSRDCGGAVFELNASARGAATGGAYRRSERHGFAEDGRIG